MPQGLRRQFQSLRGALFRVQTLTCITLSLSLPALAILLVFLSDRFWDSPSGLRQILHSTGLAGMALCIGWWIYIWTIAKPNYERLARLVQRYHRGLGDRLLGVVELCEHASDKTNLSPELQQAAIHQVAAEAQKYDFTKAVDQKWMTRSYRTAAAAGVAWLLMLLLSPAACLNAMHRWWEPASNIQRYSLVQLKGLPESKIVPRGETITQKFEVVYRSIWQPKTIKAKLASGLKIVTPLENQKAALSVPGQSDNTSVMVKIGDDWHSMHLNPVYRPTLQTLEAEVAPPDYLRYPAETRTLSGGSLKLLEGSQIRFKGRATRDLRWAHVHLADAAPTPLNIQSNRFTSDWMDLSQAFQVSFTWMDRHSLTNMAPWTLTMDHEEDQPPIPKLEGLPALQMAILETEILDFTVVATDDYGIRETGYIWTSVDAPETEPSETMQGEEIKENTVYDQTETSASFNFSPLVQQFPPNSIAEVRAFATDWLPGRERQFSQPLRLFIIDVEDHFEMVRQSLETLLTDLEGITRLQDEILSRLKSLESLDESELQGEETTKSLEESIADQEKNRQMLDQMSEQGMDTFMEAMRNPMFDPQSLEEWSENIQKMQELAKQSMPQASQTMQSAKAQPDQRPQSLAQATEQEEEILEALEQLQSQVSSGLDDLEAKTLAQRLRDLASKEVEIREDIKEIITATIGLRPQELSEPLKTANQNFADQQLQTRESAEVLTGEIGRYFERTQVERYGDVAREIESSDVLFKLEELSRNINDNIAMKSIDALTDWEQKFLAWADQLEPPKPPSEGGEGEGGEGSESEEIRKLLENLVALVRAKQDELGIRRQTQMLEKSKENNPRYPETAAELQTRQTTVSSEVRDVQMETLDANLETVLNNAFRSMKEASGLLETPVTGDPVDSAMASSILHLSDAINLINEQIERSNDSNQSSAQESEEMAFLLQLMNMAAQSGMTMQPGNQPGKSTRGGDTDQVPDRLGGNFRGKTGEDRDVIKGSGMLQNAPAEFRQALENYYRLLESEVQP